MFLFKVKNIASLINRCDYPTVRKLRNPRILGISFRTFGHREAIMEHHKTRGILHVMQVLCHKNINNTLIYTHLIDFKDDEYVSKGLERFKMHVNP